MCVCKSSSYVHALMVQETYPLVFVVNHLKTTQSVNVDAACIISSVRPLLMETLALSVMKPGLSKHGQLDWQQEMESWVMLKLGRTIRSVAAQGINSLPLLQP